MIIELVRPHTTETSPSAWPGFTATASQAPRRDRDSVRRAADRFVGQQPDPGRTCAEIGHSGQISPFRRLLNRTHAESLRLVDRPDRGAVVPGTVRVSEVVQVRADLGE
jgi:hypothetical protein